MIHAKLTAALAVAAASVSAAPPPVEQFTRRPDISGVAVSPSNTHAAFLARSANGRKALAVVDLANPKSITVTAGYGNVDVQRVQWVNDKRLVYTVYPDSAWISVDEIGTLAANIDGTDERELITARSDASKTGTRIRSRTLTDGWYLQGPVGDGSDDVLVVHAQRDSSGVQLERYKLGRLNSSTGELKILSDGLPSRAAGWVLDPKGELRMAQGWDKGRMQLYWRDDQGAWGVIENHPLFSNDAVSPLYIEADGTVIVSSVRGRDTAALFTYDPKTRKLGDELVGLKGFDVGDAVEFDYKTRRISGVHAMADDTVTVWFDERLSKLQKQVDAALPDRVNTLLCGNCEGARYFVVKSSNDRQSGEYFVFDSSKSSFTPMGQARPWMKEADQGRRTFHRVPARDGLPMPTVVTHPVGMEGRAQPLPAVMLVHGGPWVRGATRAWSSQAQFLASRGYRVLEVDFRGSTGLGVRHFTAGINQWGLGMQDDLVDALDWAVAQKLVDKDRVCIVGGSYGGYAALMGPVRHPDRYKCAASFAGVTDIMLMFDDGNSDLSAFGRDYSMPMLIGDPQKDAERLRQTSPVHRVADIKVPVLLMQGGQDRRVTKEHANRFVSAARAAQVDIEFVEYPEEGHGLSEPGNHADYLQRLEKLLARTLKP